MRVVVSTMEKVTLYIDIFSPPARATLMTVKQLGLDINVKEISLRNGDHLSEEFLKLNPQHTIPVLVDDGKAIRDSHAIMIYLVEQYAKNDDLYPKDDYIRALINAALHFESGILFARMRFMIDPLRETGGSKEIAPDRLEYFHKGLKMLEDSMTSDYIVGDCVTLADISLITTIASFIEVMQEDMIKYPKIKKWVQKMQLTPNYDEVNKPGIAKLKESFNMLTGKTN